VAVRLHERTRGRTALADGPPGIGCPVIASVTGATQVLAVTEPSGHARITGPCADTMEMWILVRDGVIAEASFATDGCGPAHASGSMATCLVKDKPLPTAAAMNQGDVLSALGDLPEEVRHCALLAANTLRCGPCETESTMRSNRR
jgi:nitrogen fixation NifU-like protein